MPLIQRIPRLFIFILFGVSFGEVFAQGVLEINGSNSDHWKIETIDTASEHDGVLDIKILNGATEGASVLKIYEQASGASSNPAVASDYLCTADGVTCSSVSTLIGVTASGTSGALQFSDGSGGFSSDATNLFWDDTNDRLGIGTATPDYDLELGGDTVGIKLNPSNGFGRDFRLSASGADMSIVGEDGGNFYIQNKFGSNVYRLNLGEIIPEHNFEGDIALNKGISTAATAALDLETRGASSVGIKIQGSASQSANLTEWQDSSSTVLSSIDSSGVLNAAGLTINGNYTFPTVDGTSDQIIKTDGSGVLSWVDQQGGITSIGDCTSGACEDFILTAPAVGTTPITVKAAASQTANLQEWYDGNGDLTASISADGATLSVGNRLNTTPDGKLEIAGYNDTRLSLNANNGWTKWDIYTGVNDSLTFEATGNNQHGDGFVFKDQDFTLQDSTGSKIFLFDYTGFEPVYFGLTNTNSPYADLKFSVMDSWTGPKSYKDFVLTRDGMMNWYAANLDGTDAATVGLTVQGAASQTANLTEWQDSTGDVKASITSGGNFSNDQGSNSTYPNEQFGDGASITGMDSVGFGQNVSAGSSIWRAVVIGNDASVTGNNGIAIGQNSTAAGNALAIGTDVSAAANSLSIGSTSSCLGGSCTAVGIGAIADSTYGTAIGSGANAGTGGVSIGHNSTTNGFAGSVAIGAFGTSATASQQFVVGSTGGYRIADVYIGKGVTDATPTDVTYHATGGSGTDIAGANISIAGGTGTGSGAGGSVFIKTADGGATGSTANTLTERFKVADDGVITFNQSYSFPTADGTNNQVLQTDGSGVVSWATAGAGDIESVGDCASGSCDDFTLTAATTATIPLVVKGAASQSANIQEWHDSSGTIDAYIDSNGDAKFKNKITLNSDVVIQRYGGHLHSPDTLILGAQNIVDASFLLNLNTGVSTGGIATRAPSSGTANFFKIENYGGTDNNLAIRSDGQITIGNTGTSFSLPTADGSANQVLQTDGSGAVSWATISSASSSGASGSIQFSDGSSGFSADATNLFWDDTNNRLGIGMNNPSEALDVTGNILASGTITALSDERLKTNIETMDPAQALENVKNMRGVRYDWKDSGRGTDKQVGVIAQEVESVYPELVNNNGPHKSVNYQALSAVLIQAVQALETRVAELETQLDSENNSE